MEHRNIVHSVFRSLRVGKTDNEVTIAAEMAQLLAALEDQRSSPFNPKSLFQKAFANIICRILLGTQYTYNDPEFQEVKTAIAAIGSSTLYC